MALHAGLEIAVQKGVLRGVKELVPAHSTVLIQCSQPMNLSTLQSAAASIDLSHNPSDALSSEVEIPVDYACGEDLEFVAEHLQMSVEKVISWHTETTWMAAFGGFAPGFMYLVPTSAEAPSRSVPRRNSPRTAIPSGAVALADTFSAIYPRESPGGWQIIGRTDEPIFDLQRKQPALIMPGDIVRFIRLDTA